MNRRLLVGAICLFEKLRGGKRSSSLALSLVIIAIIIGCAQGGNAPGLPFIQDLYSNIFRTVGSTQITQNSEVTTYGGSGSSPTLPSNYQEVTNILTDDDGGFNANAGCVSNCTTIVSITAAQHAAFVDCGTTQTSIASRISDCSSKNGSPATWIGSVNSTGGQGNWYLVTHMGANKEVWQDARTGLIWSSKLTPAGATAGENWCRAVGNAQSNDLGNYCNNVGGTVYQPVYPTPESDCAEPTGAVASEGWCSVSGYSTQATCLGAPGIWTANTENFAAGTYAAAKGGMGANSATLKVRWRLPTMNDYKLADVDGLRFVMPDMNAFDATPNWEWSSSVYSINRSYGLIFLGSYGFVNNDTRNTNYVVRCVGR